MVFQHWQFFISMESDLAQSTQYVYPCSDNDKVFSAKFAELLLRSGSEIDVVCRALCRKIYPRVNPKNIDDYRNTITTKYPKLHTMSVYAPSFGIQYRPWDNWQRQTNPDWWHAYNKVKHRRDIHFKQANFGNAFLAVCGLFCVVLYLYDNKINELSPWPQILEVERQPSHLIATQGSPLPDQS